jgi:hypothetical protein
VHDSGWIIGTVEGAGSDQLWETTFQVETTGLGITKASEEGAVGRALADLSEMLSIKSRAIQQVIEALLLGCLSKRLVLGSEKTEVVCLALCPLQGLMSRKVGTLVGEHSGEHLAGALLDERAVVSCGGVGVEGRVDVPSDTGLS